MPSCCVKWCRSHTDMKNSGITFHRFPRNEIRQEKWIAAVRLERNEFDWIPSQVSVVCSIHFRSDDMYICNTGKRNLLKKTAEPICTMVDPKFEANLSNEEKNTQNISNVYDCNSTIGKMCKIQSPNSANLDPCCSNIASKAQKRKLDVLGGRHEREKKPKLGRGVPPPMPQPIPTEKTETATDETQEDPETGDEEMQPVEIKQEFEEENLIVSYIEIHPQRIGTTPAQPTDEDPISIHRIQPSTSTAASIVDPLVKTEIAEEPEIRDSDSDIESAFDTPKEAELRRIIKKKDKVIKQQKTQKQNIYNRNKRLVAKIGRLQELLKQRRCKVCNSELTL